MYYKFDYKEELPPPYKSTENGWLPGLHLAYIYSGGLDAPIYLKVLFEYTGANTTYDGTTQSGIPVKDKTKNTFMNMKGNLGITFIRSKNSNFSLKGYSGIGYRDWTRGLGGESPYREYYKWKYMPVGLKTFYKFNKNWNCYIDFSANLMFGGVIKVNLSDVDYLFNNPEIGLKSKIGWRIEPSLNYNFQSNYSFVFSPWYEYSAIGRSDNFTITYGGWLIGYGYEPSSRTHQYGINAGMKFVF